MSSSPFYSPATDKSSLLIELEASISELTLNLEKDVPQASLVAALQDLDENSPFPKGDTSSQRSDQNRLSLGLSSDFGVSHPAGHHPPFSSSFRELEERIDRQLSAYVPADQLDAIFAEYEQELRLRGQSLQDFEDTNSYTHAPPTPVLPSPQYPPILERSSAVNASISLAIPLRLPVTSHQETVPPRSVLPNDPSSKTFEERHSKSTQDSPPLITDQLNKQKKIDEQGSIFSHSDKERERDISTQKDGERRLSIYDGYDVLLEGDLAGGLYQEKNDISRDEGYSTHPARDSLDQQTTQKNGIIRAVKSSTAVETVGATAPRSGSLMSISSDLSFASELGDTDTNRTRSSHSSFEFGDPLTLSANLDSMLHDLDMFTKSFVKTQVLVKEPDEMPLQPRYEEPVRIIHEQTESYKPKPAPIITASVPMQKPSAQSITPSSVVSDKTISLLTPSPDYTGVLPPLPSFAPRFEYIRSDEPHALDTAISISTSGSPNSTMSNSSPNLTEAKGPAARVKSAENLSRSASGDTVGLKKMTSRIYINDLTQFKTIPFTTETTVDSVVPVVKKRINLEDSDEWTLFELVGRLGVERPLRDYERVVNVVAGWGLDNKVDNISKSSGSDELLIIKKYGFREILTAEAAMTNSFPQLFGWLLIETKRGKWSKRFVTLRDGALWWGKDTKGTSESILCSLAMFDVYTLTRPRKGSPSKFCFCLKSQKPIEFFEHPETDYAHFVCADHFDKMRDWVLSVRAAKSRMVWEEEERRRVNASENEGVMRETEQEQLRKQNEWERERQREGEREREKARNREREKESEVERGRERARAADTERKREKERGRDQVGEKHEAAIVSTSTIPQEHKPLATLISSAASVPPTTSKTAAVAETSRRKQVQESGDTVRPEIRKKGSKDLINKMAAPLLSIDPKPEQKHTGQLLKQTSKKSTATQPLIRFD